MTTSTELRKAYSRALREVGFTGRGSVWRYLGHDLQWTCQISVSNWGRQVSLDIGLDPQIHEVLSRADDSPIVMYLETFAGLDDALEAVGTDRIEVSRAGRLDSDLGVDEREVVIVKAAAAVHSYVQARGDLDSVRFAFRRGEFRTGFIRKDVREAFARE